MNSKKESNSNMADKQTVVTPEFRVAFANVFKASSYQGGTPSFGFSMVFQKDADLKALKRLAAAAAKEKWGDKIPKGLRSPFRDGSVKEHLDGFDDSVVFATAKSKFQPGLVDQALQPIIDETEFYSGCYARATVTAYAYDNQGNKGVAFGLQNAQKLRDGKAFGGRTDASEDFDAVDTPAASGEGSAAPEADDGDDLFGS